MERLDELKTTLIQLNPWWDNPDSRHDILRRTSFAYVSELKNKTIDVLIGARRVGKTSIVRNIINDLLNFGIKARHRYSSSEIIPNHFP